MNDHRRPTPLAEALAGWIDGSGLKTRLAQAGVIGAWAELVGPQIAAVTTPETVGADGVLRVRVATAPWANELSLMTPVILARLNRAGGARIRDIRWMAGGGTAPGSGADSRPRR